MPSFESIQRRIDNRFEQAQKYRLYCDEQSGQSTRHDQFPERVTTNGLCHVLND